MTSPVIALGTTSVASARHARGSHACPCAGVPWAAWVSAKRTGRTAFLKVMDNSCHSCGIFRLARAHEKVKRAVRAVRFPECHARQGKVAHGRECGGVRSAAAVCDVGQFCKGKFWRRSGTGPDGKRIDAQ